MKKVQSLAELKRLALSRGAQVELGGSKFNTTMEVVRQASAEIPPSPPPPPPPPLPPPEPELTPEPAPPPVAEETIHIHLDMDPVAQAIESGNERVVQAIADRMRELQVPASGTTPKSWTFKIKRDVRGFIESVDATPRL